ncbi:hypothetical protein [Chitinilyticum aquatile]|uniref:hypothetical protein n=1 Tax=Chitinilyticum aquatile TaxID=362520 RepID=UPI000419B058|nr:hypothetical protein [Chitinilyticum aquatile]
MSDVETPAVESVSFLQRFRLHLLLAAGVVLLLIALLGGIAAGMAKRNFEKQFYLEQIDKLKRALEKSTERYQEVEQELSEVKVQLRARKEHVEELEFKLESLEKRAQMQAAPAAPQAAPAEGGHAAVQAGKAEKAPLPRLAGDCTIKSGASGVVNLQDCLRPAPAQKTPAAPADVHTEKPAKAH